LLFRELFFDPAIDACEVICGPAIDGLVFVDAAFEVSVACELVQDSGDVGGGEVTALEIAARRFCQRELFMIVDLRVDWEGGQ